MKTRLVSLIKRLANVESGLGKAFVANFSFAFINVLLSIVFTRIYVQYLGAEGYGIIGFYNSVIGLFYVFDFGMSATISREMAKLTAQPDKIQQVRNLVRSLEVVILICSLMALVILTCLSFFAAHYWVTSKTLTQHEVLECFLLMGAMIFFHLLFGFYLSGLMGLGKHVLINFLLCFVSILRYFGSAAVLIFISQKIQAFLLWQLFVAFFQSVILFFIFWKSLSGFYLSKFEPNLLRSVYRFAAGISLAGFFGLVVLHVDKVILGRILDLEKLGYYSFSIGLIVMVFGVFINPLYNSTYPLFSKLLASGEMDLLRKNYHRSCQLLAVFLIPSAFFVAFFSREILQIWLREENFVINTAPVLSVLAVAWIGLASKIVPHRLRLAYGWVRLDFYENLFGAFWLATLIAIGAHYYGVLGAAIALLVFAYSSALLVVYMTHRKILKEEYRKWLLLDTLLPFLISLFLVGVGKQMLDLLALNELLKVVFGLVFLIFSVISLILVMREIREYVFLIGLSHFRLLRKF